MIVIPLPGMKVVDLTLMPGVIECVHEDGTFDVRSTCLYPTDGEILSRQEARHWSEAPDSRSAFLARMEAELAANAHKGDWAVWKPSPFDAMTEVERHLAKYRQAVYQRDHERMREFAADVANIAQKMHDVADEVATW